jgi:ABC-type antimicrobial peptide transport system permease subunit
MIWTKLVFGGLGKRGLEAAVAGVVLTLVVAVVAAALMVIGGARDALKRTERNDRPDIVQVKSRFNRALFETPRSGNLPPLTLPVYEPLIDPAQLRAAAGSATVVPRQSLLRNVVSGDTFLNIYIFGIDSDIERQVSRFSLARGRFLRNDDGAVAVLDKASARALGVDLGGTFPIRKADGEDLNLTVIGILDGVAFNDAPPRTIEAPALMPDSGAVSSGAFVSLRTSQEIFGRDSLTDALVVARDAAEVPGLVSALQEAFRLEPGIFITERYAQFQRKVHDFVLILALFTIVAGVTALLAGSFAANLLHDVYAERQRQYATLIAIGFSPSWGIAPGIVFGLAVALSGIIAGGVIAILTAPRHFAMPSLMADLGTIEPKMNWAVAGAAILVAVGAVIIGIVPIGLRIMRRPIAATLVEST